jgi:hypothetical protein
MSSRNRQIMVGVLFTVAGLILMYNLGWMTFWKPALGEGKPCEIIRPVDGSRITTTWKEVYRAAAEKPPKAFFLMGDGYSGWVIQLPEGVLGWVVNPGEEKKIPPPVKPSTE